MIKIVLLRHGESTWNKENKFTGWTDVPLSDLGVEQAKEAGKVLKQEGYSFDKAFTSLLKRGTETLRLCLEEMGIEVPIEYSWKLNERHYGALQGENKKEAVEKFGADQVFKWRRSYDVRPPELSDIDPRHPKNNPLFKDIEDIPSSECLKDVLARVLPYWKEEIVPEIKAGKKLIISAHGNSLRALVKYLDKVSDQEIANMNIPVGVPLVYELDDDLVPIKHYYLGDQEKIKSMIDKVRDEIK